MHTKLITLLLATVATLASAAGADAPRKLYTIPSWGDFAVVYANGTDPAMDSPEGDGEHVQVLEGARLHRGVSAQ